jgi:hypothetical protein
MADNSAEEQTLSDDIYISQSIPKKYFLLVGLLLSIISLFSIPWGQLLKLPNLAQIMGCPAQHSSINANFFPPGVFIKNLTLPSACTGVNNNLIFNDLIISFGGISFSPFGPVINIKTNLENFPLQAKIAVGLNQVNFSSYYEKLPLNKLVPILNKYVGLPIILEGNAKLDLRVSIINQQLDEYKLDITSNDLSLPSQMITFLKVPDLPLKTLNLKAQGKKNNLSLDNLTLGSSSNLLLQSKGNFLLDFNFMPNTQLNLDLELKLSQALNQEFSLLSNLIGKSKVAEGQYKMKFSGTLSAPVF